MGFIGFGILTVSDSCYENEILDKSGPELVRLVSDDATESGKHLKGQIRCKKIVPDNIEEIMNVLVNWSDKEQLDVIVTTGGTGFSERDVTPEATKRVIQKEALGMALAMFMTSYKITPMAILSRAVCGIRGKTLIVNLPGSPKAVKECFTTIARTIPHAVSLLKDDEKEVTATHKNVQRSTSGSCTHKCQTVMLPLGNVTERPRASPFRMICVDEALKILSDHAKVPETEIIKIEMAHGRILFSTLCSKYDLPPFRASIKDGYAVLASDGKGRRKVLGGIKAGSSTNVTLSPGTCVRVNTGAPIPDDATAVVQVEDTKLLEGTVDNLEEKEIEILTEVKHGQDVRPVGCDIQKGEFVVNGGTKLGAVELGLLAACGFDEITVTMLPSIGVLSTGDELQCTGEPLMPGHVYDSNKITLMSILRDNGFKPLDMGIARDDEAEMSEKIKEAVEQVDVLITSGSVSMGDRDMLKPILQHHFNATIHFGRVNMKPGKPTTFATCTMKNRKKYFLCLPGNPVSATVTMHLFALPLLKQLSLDGSKPTIVDAELTSSYDLDPRPEYARGILNWDGNALPKAYSTGNQMSSKLLNCRNANALLMLPARTAERRALIKGDVVKAMLLGFAQST